MTNISNLFPESYEASRARFRKDLEQVQRLWPDARLASHRITGDEDLTIDWIETPGLDQNDKLLILTTGEHGIEGFVGSAMLQLFIEEFLPRLDPEDTGLLLVHTINPWGMKHRRRTNAANVDLNRNFVRDPTDLDPAINLDYAALVSLLNPRSPVDSLFLSDMAFVFKLLWSLMSMGSVRIRQATLLGQYRFPQGIYYGGDALQEETQMLMDLYRGHFREYERIVHLDMHTGYGPRYQMSVVNSCLEPRCSEELARRFACPRVVKADLSEFYSMRGDMIDYVYALVRDGFPDKQFCAASFEFGTLGDSTLQALRSLRTMVLENRLHWYGAGSQRVREQVARGFQELFAPQEARWRAKAVADARQAFEGILRAEGFLVAESIT